MYCNIDDNDYYCDDDDIEDYSSANGNSNNDDNNDDVVVDYYDYVHPRANVAVADYVTTNYQYPWQIPLQT